MPGGGGGDADGGGGDCGGGGDGGGDGGKDGDGLAAHPVMTGTDITVGGVDSKSTLALCTWHL